MRLYNILVVDDEINNLNALKRTFRSDYNVFSATSGEDALSMMEQYEITLIITGYHMPGMTGIELLEKTSRDYPDTIRIILAAYTNTEEESLADAISMGYVHKYVTKPWEPEELRAVIKEQLDSASQVQKAERKRIGEILVENGAISESQLAEALELQKQEEKHDRRKLGEILVGLGYTDEETIISYYALQFGMPYVLLSQLPNKPDLAELLTSKLARKYAIVPVDMVGRVFVVATSEPLRHEAKSEIERRTGRKVMAVCTSREDLEAALEKYYPKPIPLEDGSQYR